MGVFQEFRDPKNSTIIYSNGYGENRAVQAAETVFEKVKNGNYDISGTKTIYLQITSGENEITIDEIGKINDILQSKLGSGVNIIISVEEKNISSDLEIIVIFTNLVNPISDLDFNNFMGQNDKEVSTLPVYFIADEYTQEEIAQTISFLSDLYTSIGGDRLKIKGFQCIDVKVNSLEPVF